MGYENRTSIEAAASGQLSPFVFSYVFKRDVVRAFQQQVRLSAWFVSEHVVDVSRAFLRWARGVRRGSTLGVCYA